MNSLERVQATINFEPTDRVPVFSHVYGFASKLVGISLREYLSNGRLMAQCQIEAWRRFKHDGVSAFADSCLEAEALGSKVSYSGDDIYPHIEEPILRHVRDISSLSIPDPHRDGRMPVVLEACKILREEVGEQTPVIGTIQGPMTLAGQLIGMETLIYTVVDSPEEFNQILDFTTQVTITFAKVLVEAGAHVIQIFDPSSSCSVINRAVFCRHVFPNLRRIFTELRKEPDLICWLSITGRTQPILDLLPKTGAHLFNIDYLVPISLAMEKLSHHCINGNIKPFAFISGSAKEIEKEAQILIEKAHLRRGFILSPGCEIPLGSKATNIEAMIRVAHTFR